jgi:nucleotide-binding universal stress UspA family protein
MKAIKKILFPVDFSDRCRGTASFVEAVAGRFNSEVLILHVVPPMPEAYYPRAAPNRDFCSAELQIFLAGDFSYLPVRRLLAFGDPATRIIETARAEKVDLIMMPTHGYGPFRRFLLGSVVGKVLCDAECPVWTGVHMEEAPPLDKIEFRRMVCAVDLDEKGEETLQQAFEIADEYGAALTVVHAISATEARPDKYIETEFRNALMDHAREELAAILHSARIAATICVGAGEIAKVVHSAALSHKADLLVIGRSSPGLLGRLRTHGYGIVRESPCPVLSL